MDPEPPQTAQTRAAIRSAVVEPTIEEQSTALATAVGIDALAPVVADYLRELADGGLDDGPLNFTPRELLDSHAFTYHKLFGFGPSERFFPAFLIAGEYGGVEFWCMLETGRVIALHHDATFFEVARDVYSALDDDDMGAFCRRFEEAGAALTIAQLVAFQQTFSQLRGTDELATDDLDEDRAALERVAAAFGWSYDELIARIDDQTDALEFLFSAFRFYFESEYGW